MGYMGQDTKQFVSTAELARILGVSRVAVFKKIKKGHIKATRVGRAFVIERDDIPQILGSVLTGTQKKGIEDAVARTIKEYGETLRLPGRE